MCWKANIPPGLSQRANPIQQDSGNQYAMTIIGPGLPSSFLTALKLVQFSTTSPDRTPRNIQVTLTQVDNIESLRPARTIIYLV